MLLPADLILLPYTSDLTPAGIAFACQTLPYPDCRNTTQTYQQLRRIVAQQAAELAFRRHLTMIQVPHKLGQESIFARPGRISAVIGGRLCNLYSSAIFNREAIRCIHQNPASMLSSPARIPLTDLTQENRSGTDLLIFSFVTGLVTYSVDDINKAKAAGKPIHLLYPLPAAWSQQSSRSSLGRIVLKSESESSLCVSLGGYTGNNCYTVLEIDLPPLQRLQTQENFHSLVYVHINGIPTKRVGLHSRALGKTVVVHPYQWGNVWIYGMKIILAGWMSREEFRRYARPCRNDPYHFTPHGNGNKYLAVPVDQLRPLEDLFSRALSWG